MGKEFDELSKALASGVSRRRAVRRFLLGSLGVAAATLIPGRTSFGQSQNSQCEDICRSLGCRHADFGRCVAACEQDIQFNGVQFNGVQFNGVQFNCV